MANIETITVGDTTFDVATTPANMKYSTIEKVVGTWIDGKPVYERTISGLSVSASSGKKVNIPNPISNIKFFVYSFLINTNSTIYRTISSPPIWLENDNIVVRIQEQETYDTLIVQYTKTTD